MKVAAKHDFAAKLRQAPLMSAVVDYVRWQKKVREARQAGAPAPEMPPIGLVSLNLDLTTACNFRCSHCVDFDNLNTGIHHAEQDLFESLENLISEGLRSVILIGGGEPTIHRKFEEVVRFLKERNVQVGIVTNGARGDVLERVAPMLCSRDWIRLSLDSGRNETFVKMHLPRSKSVTLEGICAWVPKIRQVNPDVQVGFSYIIVWDGSQRTEGVGIVSNIDEMVEAVKLAKAYRFSYVSFKPYLTRFGDGAEVVDLKMMADRENTLERIARAIAEAKKLESKDFKVLESTNLRVLMEGNWREYTNQPTTCHVMAFRQVLSPLGVFHCPSKRGSQHAWVADKNAFTSLKKEETRRAMTSMLETFDASQECRETTCLYNQANWWLENLIASDGDQSSLEPLPDRGDYYL
jgi:molybdenum cofactor biosynthesis enzyme MoaA